MVNSLEVKDENMPALDEQYENEIKESGGVTTEMIDITIKYAEVWKQEMERYYNQLYDVLDDKGKNWLDNSQKAWEEYSTSNKELAFYVEEQRFGGGSYLNILEADLLYQKYRRRALELREIYGEMVLGAGRKTGERDHEKKSSGTLYGDIHLYYNIWMDNEYNV